MEKKELITMGKRWKLPWVKKQPQNQYDQVYSSRNTKKGGTWLKEQGRETLKQLPRTIAQAGVGAVIMTGISSAMGPDQIAEGDATKNQAIFLYDGSKSTGPNILEIIAIVTFSLLLLIAFPLVFVPLRNYINICTCRRNRSPRIKVIEDVEDVDVIPEMEDHDRFGIDEIIGEMETREERSRKPDIRMKVTRALENIESQNFVEGGE